MPDCTKETDRLFALQSQSRKPGQQQQESQSEPRKQPYGIVATRRLIEVCKLHNCNWTLSDESSSTNRDRFTQNNTAIE